MTMSNREKIEKYFNGELNPYELEQLLREIQSNAALSKLYLEYQTAIQSIQEAGKATLKDRLDSIGKQIDKRKQIKKAFISAIVILGFGFSIYLYIDYSKNIKEESPGTLEPKPEKQLEIALIDSLNVTDSLQVDQLKDPSAIAYVKGLLINSLKRSNHLQAIMKNMINYIMNSIHHFVTNLLNPVQEEILIQIQS